MVQTGTVVDITESGLLIVTVKQSTACDGCHKKDGCVECASSIEVSAYNRCEAKIGDTVELETATGRVLFYAFLVFLFPFLPAVIGYMIADRLTSGEVIPIITALIALSATFLILRLTVDRKAARRCDCVAVRII